MLCGTNANFHPLYDFFPDNRGQNYSTVVLRELEASVEALSYCHSCLFLKVKREGAKNRCTHASGQC